jgi:hypothetical protein
MEISGNHYSSSMAFKIITCLFASVAIATGLGFLIRLLPREILLSLNYQLMMFILLGGALIAGTAITLLWVEKEKEESYKGALWQAYLLGLIRYWLAFMISTYGFAKIFKTQFTTADFIKDIPLGEVNGFNLTWYYFGYSYTLAVIIALFQIGGSILLLFRRTTLLATLILLPVMVNIVLINMFYNIAVGAFVISVLLTLGLTYLLLLDFEKLKAAFWAVTDKLPALGQKRPWLKLLVRLLPILAAFGMVYSFVWQDTSDKLLLGTWKVTKFIRNDSLLPADAWIKDRHVFTKVYFSGLYGCAFSPNPYVYDATMSLQGQYSFDSQQSRLQFIYYSGNRQPDTLQALVSGLTSNSMNLEGVLNKDTLRMELVKIDRVRN